MTAVPPLIVAVPCAALPTAVTVRLSASGSKSFCSTFTVTAAVAWYTSAAGVVNGMSPRPVLPVGGPLWDRLPVFSQLGSPMPRRTEA